MRRPVATRFEDSAAICGMKSSMRRAQLALSRSAFPRLRGEDVVDHEAKHALWMTDEEAALARIAELEASLKNDA